MGFRIPIYFHSNSIPLCQIRPNTVSKLKVTSHAAEEKAEFNNQRIIINISSSAANYAPIVVTVNSQTFHFSWSSIEMTNSSSIEAIHFTIIHQIWPRKFRVTMNNEDRGRERGDLFVDFDADGALRDVPDAAGTAVVELSGACPCVRRRSI